MFTNMTSESPWSLTSDRGRNLSDATSRSDVPALTSSSSIDVIADDAFTDVSVSSLSAQDTEVELMSAHTAQMIETVVQAGILPELVLCGVIMNVINMAVFWRQGLRDRINICLFSLAASDSGYLVSLFSSRVYSLVSLLDAGLGQYWKARSLVLVGVYTGFLNTSSVLTLLVALDRCCCVVIPLKAKVLISTRHVRLLVTLVFAVCLCCCGLACFKFDVIAYTDATSNVTRYRSGLTAFGREHSDVIDAVFQFTFNVAVPTVTLLVVMVCTAVIAVQMRRTMTWRQQTTATALGAQTSSSSSSTERREAALIRMLVVVCVIFCLCTLPAVTLTFVRHFVPGFQPNGRYTNAFYASNCLMHLLSCLNSSVNFWIYYVMGSKFKATLRKMVAGGSRCCCWGRRRDERGGEGGSGASSSSSAQTVYTTSGSCAASLASVSHINGV